jgi:hypothetical protein
MTQVEKYPSFDGYANQRHALALSGRFSVFFLL